MTLNDQKVGPIACVWSSDVIRNPIGLIRGGLLRDAIANRRWGGCWVTRRCEGFFEENWRERLRTVNTEVIWDGTIFCRTRYTYWRRYIVYRITTVLWNHEYICFRDFCGLSSLMANIYYLQSHIYRECIHHESFTWILDLSRTHDVVRLCSHANMGQGSWLLTPLHLQVVLFQLSGFKGSWAQPAAGSPLQTCVLLLHGGNWMSLLSKDSRAPLSYAATVASAR